MNIQKTHFVYAAVLRACGWLRHTARPGVTLVIALALAAGMTAVMPPHPVSAATLAVNNPGDTVDANPGDGVCADSGGKCTLRAAIMEANARAGADTITVPAGTYTLTIAGVDDNTGAQGDLNILSDLTITGAGGNRDGDAAQTIIQAGTSATNGIDRVISVNSTWDTALNVTIEAVTVRYGRNYTDDFFGGGIDWEASGTGNLTLYNCIIRDNSAKGTGGGIFASNSPRGSGKLTITKSTIIGNKTEVGGGGVGLGGVLFEINNSVITGNTSESGGGLDIYNNVYDGAMSTITGTTISANKAASSPNGGDIFGGGLRSTGAVRLVNSTVSGNTAEEGGGGIYAWLNGGATTADAGSLELVNTTVSGNSAEGYGGGMFITLDNAETAPTVLPKVTIINGTITKNTSETAGAGLYRDAPKNGAITAYNTIIAGNLYQMTPSDVEKDAGLDANALDAASANNLIGAAGASGLTNGVNGNLVNVPNPGLGPLANNGGSIMTHALLPGSPAVEAGSNAFVTAPPFSGSPITDARGTNFPRLLDSADPDAVQTVDIGAYELHPTIENIGDQTVANGTTLNLPFNVGDGTLGFTSAGATSSNTAAVPNDAAHLSISGSGSTRTLSATPAALGATTITVTLTSVIGGVTFTATDTFVLTVTNPADLTIAKTHTGAFTQGQAGSYAISVTNSGGVPTNGTVTVTDTLPTGMTVSGMSGSGWGCITNTLTCTRSDVLAAGASYPPINLTVSVAPTAPPELTNTAKVSGGGEVNTNNNTASDVTTIIQLPDPVVIKTHTGNFTQGQVGVQYTLTVKNQGTGATTGTVTVKDTLPAGLTATAISGTGWSCTLGTLTCTRSDVLAAGASYPVVTLTVNVAKNAPTSVTNAAAVSGGGDTVTNNNTTTDLTTVLLLQDLVITKTHNGDFKQGQTDSYYRMTISNVGQLPTNAAVTVTDTLPAGLTATYISGTGWTCTLATLTCTRQDALPAGQSYPYVHIMVTVADNAPASLTNTATVSGGGEDRTDNNSASDPTVVIQAPDLVVNKTHTGVFEQGKEGTFTIVVSNVGPGPTTTGGVAVRDTPNQYMYIQTMEGPGWSCDLETRTCYRSDILDVNASFPAITVTVQILDFAPTPLLNTAEVSTTFEMIKDNNSSRDTVDIIQHPDLVVSKTHMGNFAQGQAGAQYTLQVRNAANGLWSGAVTVKDTLPEGMTAVAMGGEGWTCDLPNLTCTREDGLDAGASYPDITLSVDVSRTAPGTLVNRAEVSGSGDTDTTNNTAEDETTIEQAADMVVAKHHTGAFRQGQKGATFTLTVSNNGTGGVKGQVTLTDLLPVGLTASAMSGEGWTCSLPTLTCTRSDALEPGESYPDVTLTANVAPDAPERITNKAEVSGGGEFDLSNNTAEDPTDIAQVADLTVTSTHQGRFYPGQKGVELTITVKNSGKGSTDGTAVKVVDKLPAGMTLVSIAGSGWICDVKTATCTRTDTLKAGASYPVITLKVDVAPGAKGTLTNSVSVSGGGEAITTNNTATDPAEIAWPDHIYLVLIWKP